MTWIAFSLWFLGYINMARSYYHCEPHAWRTPKDKTVLLIVFTAWPVLTILGLLARAFEEINGD